MPNGQPLPASIIRGSIEEALHLWSSAAPINFVEVPDDGLYYGSSTHYGQIRFSHIYINGPDPTIGDPVAKAQTYFPPGDGYPGDVEFDDSDAWQVVGTLRQPDVLGAAIHEIGHSLGLGHATGIIPGEYWSYQVYDGTGQVIDHLEPKGNADMFWIFQSLQRPGHRTIVARRYRRHSSHLRCRPGQRYAAGSAGTIRCENLDCLRRRARHGQKSTTSSPSIGDERSCESRSFCHGQRLRRLARPVCHSTGSGGRQQPMPQFPIGKN